MGLRDEGTPAMLREFQFNLTVESNDGSAVAYLLELISTPGTAGGSQWSWVADTEFGPFDTSLDVSTWLCRELVRRKALHFR